MKTTMKILTGIMIMFLFTMMISNLFAQMPDRNDRPMKANQEQALPAPPMAPLPPPPPLPPPADNQDESAQPLLNFPDLTAEQQDKIHQADLNHMKIMTPMRNQIREKKARLQTILTTSPCDIKAGNQVADDIGAIEAGILKEMIRHDQELRNLLTPQQQVLFDTRPKPFLHQRK